MPSVLITGQTFQHRETLKRLRGRWDDRRKGWVVEYPSAGDLRTLRGLVGCIVTADVTPEPDISDDMQTVLAAIIATIDKGDQPGTDSGFKTAIYGNDQTYFNTFKDINPRAFFGFSDMASLINYIDAIPHEKRTGERRHGWDNDAGEDWYGSGSMSEALDLARNGWQEGLQNAADVLDALSVDRARQRRRAPALAGGSVNVGRMLAGNPAHMIRRPKQPGRRIVTLYVQAGASARIKPRNMVVRAAIIAAISDLLQTNGYSSEIVSVWTANYGSKSAMQNVVTLKRAGETLNLSDLVFSLGHPSFLRRMMFACTCSADELAHVWDTQGQPADAFNSYFMPKQNEFYIPLLSYSDQDKLRGGSLIETARQMLPLIMPLNLPVTLT